MKTIFSLILVLLFVDAKAIERRQLLPEFEEWLVRIEHDLEVIDHGLRIGRRKEALEAVAERREQDLRSLPSFFLTWQNQVRDLKIENDRLRELLSRNNVDYLCTLRIFGREYLGIGVNEELARSRALLSCSEDYDLNLQCKRGRMECRR